MVRKSRIFMAFLILVTDASRDSNVRSLADFATRSSSEESSLSLKSYHPLLFGPWFFSPEESEMLESSESDPLSDEDD